MTENRFPSDAVRDDFIPAEAYYDRDFARLEAEKLWPSVWQMACRLEEIPNVGDYYTYDILRDSIIVVRAAPGDDGVRAFHNSCPHRGTSLTSGRGLTRQFVCPFHGWRFDTEGNCVKIVDEQDWEGCLTRADVALGAVKLGVWGGWVFINMDPNCQPLRDFLEPMATRCDPFELETMRYAWYKTITVDANWKTVQEAFLEFYHVQATHPQMLSYTKDYSTSYNMGRHAPVSYAEQSGMPIGRSPRLPPKDEPDFRNYIFEYADQFRSDLNAMQTERAYAAVQELRRVTTAETPPGEVLGKWGELIYAAAIKEGSGWPAGVTPEVFAKAGFHWQVFPNMVFLPPAIEAILGYRFRPHPDDVERSILDIWSLERYAPGKAPPLNHEIIDDWRDVDWPLIYLQDLVNIPKVQRGMRSRHFKGGRTSPLQERAISNFHRALRRFMEDPHSDDEVGLTLLD
jgi:phenylpropionate dioxygenase-like ring-hydroxylating dioxygenase large terminal subunit